jgi:two-component system, OmpR family, catabolic regulation response regulator CreB
VAKPFSPRELVARVRSILRRAAKAVAAPVASVLDGAPIAVDDGKRQIRFYGRLLELSRYEYGLLKTLAARPGHVFSRDTLLERVWDDATESLDRTVDAHVKTLRAKMKLIAPALEPIRTHRGSGYALAEDLPPEPGAGPAR